jgi:ADP-heptose:LPS heptosyltransferase
MANILVDFSASLYGEAVVDGGGNVWLPYDRAHLRVPATGWTRLSARRDVRHAGRRPFRWHAPACDTLHVLNGMGVTLGDSIIGMNALAWLKASHPALRIHLYRTPHAPRFVERLYELASHIIEPVTYLPTPLQALPENVVDLSDFLHWPSFSTAPMVDFFLRGLGIPLGLVPASAKANRWLARLHLPPVPAPWSSRRYVLFCDQASTPLRAVPQEHTAAMVERIWQQYGLPVLGFHPISHPHYRDISAHSRDLDQFMAWVKGSAAVISTDSSAMHIAAGFDVPALAVFVSIDPDLRARDYAKCRVLDVRCDLTNGLHASEDPGVLREVDRIWGALAKREDLPWPVLA